MGCLRVLVSVVIIFVVVGAIGAIVSNRPAPTPTVTGSLVTSMATAPVAASTATTEPKRSYSDRLAEADRTLDTFNFTDVRDVDDIAASIVMINEFAKEAAIPPSTDEDVSTRKKFIAKLSAVQKKVLPVLRDKYGPAMRTALWEADGKARTIGADFRTVEFISASFAANRNIKSTHGTMYQVLVQMRFTRAQYRWFDGAPEYTYYELSPPADGAVGVWSGSIFSPVN